jgi:hypothetical protein
MTALSRLVCTILVTASAAPTIAHASPAEPRTAAAVVAADAAWGRAEAKGDADFVDRLLAPEYRSVNPAGKATSKADILARTRSAGGTPAQTAEMAVWRKDHPTRADVALFGDTAVLAWVSTGTSDAGKIRSCDIFVYRDGAWHAIYSQHSDA